jgi:hypothetical protein
MKARPEPAYEKSVFINCPFDPQFEDLLLAIMFAVVAHGLVPRSAQETDGSSEPRFLRVLKTIAHSKYSIHDLSRSTGEGPHNLARFNMPLELGVACALRFEREQSTRLHKLLILVPEGFTYQRFVSDLAGFDPGRHSQSVESVIREVSAWLRVQEDAIEPAPSALQIYQAFAEFRQQVLSLHTEALEKESWADLLLAASKTVPGVGEAG